MLNHPTVNDVDPVKLVEKPKGVNSTSICVKYLYDKGGVVKFVHNLVSSSEAN